VAKAKKKAPEELPHPELGEPKAPEKPEVDGTAFVVIRKDVFNATAGYIEGQPHKQVAGLMQHLVQSTELKAFVDKHEVK
jgi:hypothetical protein